MQWKTCHTWNDRMYKKFYPEHYGDMIYHSFQFLVYKKDGWWGKTVATIRIQCTIFIVINPHLKIFSPLLFRVSGREMEREGRRETSTWCERDALIGYFLHMPWLGAGSSNPSMCLWNQTQSNHSSTQARAIQCTVFYLMPLRFSFLFYFSSVCLGYKWRISLQSNGGFLHEESSQQRNNRVSKWWQIPIDNLQYYLRYCNKSELDFEKKINLILRKPHFCLTFTKAFCTSVVYIFLLLMNR